MFNEFIAELHSKNVFPLNVTNIEELSKIINEAIEEIYKNETQINMENSVTFTIWKSVSDLNTDKKNTIIKPILENIKTTLETEVTNIKNGINKQATEASLGTRPVTAASIPVTRQRGGNKSKSNSTRKKKLKN